MLLGIPLHGPSRNPLATQTLNLNPEPFCTLNPETLNPKTQKPKHPKPYNLKSQETRTRRPDPLKLRLLTATDGEKVASTNPRAGRDPTI